MNIPLLYLIWFQINRFSRDWQLGFMSFTSAQIKIWPRKAENIFLPTVTRHSWVTGSPTYQRQKSLLPFQTPCRFLNNLVSILWGEMTSVSTFQPALGFINVPSVNESDSRVFIWLGIPWHSIPRTRLIWFNQTNVVSCDVIIRLWFRRI